MATIRKRGSKWQVQIRRSGRLFLSRSFHIRRDAETWARQMEVLADRYNLPPDPKALEQITLGELVKRYRDTVTIRKRGRDSETIVLNAFLGHSICRRSLSELRTTDFAAYREERLRTIKPISLSRQLSPIHNAFEVARDEWGLPIQENPLDRLALKTTSARRERRLREGEEDRLIEAANECRNPLVLPIIQVALETAMRRGEILGIRREHVDRERKSLLIPYTKNGDGRVIPLTPRALEIFNKDREAVDGTIGISNVNKGSYFSCFFDQVPKDKRQEREHGLLFPITPNAFRLSWERLKRRAGIEDLRFHDLRHEAISRFYELGLSTPEVALISGHRDFRMLFRYTHASREIIARKLR